MSKITISEEDLTISNQVDITENIAYIPGMIYDESENAKIDEKPRLFRSVKSFTDAYGENPYQFKSDQVVNGVTLVAAKEYEKSYIYAIELLTAGLPIYFQNIVNIKDFERTEDNKLVDSGALQYFYEKLSPVTVGENEIELENKVKVTAGTYNNGFNAFTNTDKYSLNIVKDNEIEALGIIDKEDADNTLGLTAGYRFVTKLTGLKRDGYSVTGCVIDVSNGTRNEYGPGTPAFEDNDSNELVVALNVTAQSTVNVIIKYEEIVEEESTAIPDKTEVIYTFTFGNAKLRDVEIPNLEYPEYSLYSDILDRWTYNIKFLTTGGYPTLLNTKTDYALFKTVNRAAAVRGDTIALVDIPYTENIYEAFNNINTNIEVNEDTYRLVSEEKDGLNYTLNSNRKDECTLKYGTVSGPLGIYKVYNEKLKIKDIKFPGSFGYLLSLVNTVKVLNSPDYFAIAGVSRGLVPHLESLEFETTGAEADAVQVRDAGKISLNPIVKVQNYGYCIWGNRTLFPNIETIDNPEGYLAASSFLNIRVMAADVKKVVYAACQKLTFETNNLELWLKFKAEVEPILEKMVANGALENYELKRLPDIEKATLSVYIKLVTLYAVEDFDITIGLTDSTVEQSE